MKKILLWMLSVICILSLFAGCGSQPAARDSEKLRVVCSIFPEYDWCRTIAGEHAEIELLLRSGMDLHNFEPTAQDIADISQSDVFIYVGGSSDGWATEAIATIGNPALKTLRLMDTVAAVEEELVEGMTPEDEHEHDEHDEHDEHEHDEVEYDEHIWLSLRLAASEVQAICDTLCDADPDNAQSYRDNTAAYLQKLSALDTQYADMVAAAGTKTILVADRFPFRYLADDYGLTYYAAFPGCAAASDVSFETVAFLAQKLQEQALPAVLIIDGSDGRIAETVLSTAQSEAKLLTLNSCQCVSDAQLDSATYYDMMSSNLEILREALNANGTD